MSNSVLHVEGLNVVYHVNGTQVYAVHDLSFTLGKGERLGMVGESGSGKSTTALALLRLLPTTAQISAQEIRLNDHLLTLTDDDMRAVRGRQIALIPQGAMNSLNPVKRIYDQLIDGILAHEGRQPLAALRERVGAALDEVGLKADVMSLFPHELSGGMKQRVCIAMAILLRPQVIIADEPTSALDVVNQKLVAETLLRVQERLDASVLLIGHDMGLQAQLVDRVAVMYAGHLVEIAAVDELFHRPQHPYTQFLIACIPSINEKKPLRALLGATPRLDRKITGCVFHDRCPVAIERCAHETPPLREVAPGQSVACHLVK